MPSAVKPFGMAMRVWVSSWRRRRAGIGLVAGFGADPERRHDGMALAGSSPHPVGQATESAPSTFGPGPPYVSEAVRRPVDTVL
jgi:hypothetical protein